MTKWEENEEIQIFQEYLRIPSVHPNIDYTPCVDFLKKQAKNLGLTVEVCHPGGPKKPVVILTWLGQNPEQPSIMLNSHMDVVPVYPEKWTHPPFGAEIDDEGRIYARGSQDMKCVGMQYLGAIRALKNKGVTLKRTVHVIFVPDEEIAGEFGMKAFVASSKFKELNIGFCLDEGLANKAELYPIFYAEKTIWNVELIIHGTSGHGSLLLKNTAAHKFQYILNKLMELREKAEKAINGGDQLLRLGEVDTINLTKVTGGVQNNVIPLEIRALFDIRLGINCDYEGLQKKLEQWCKEAGGGIKINFLVKERNVPPTVLNDTNSFWVAVKQTMEKLGLKYQLAVLPGISDCRFIRGVGIPALGFSPMANTPILIHDHDEWLSAETYLKGIEIYQCLVTAIANV